MYNLGNRKFGVEIEVVTNDPTGLTRALIDAGVDTQYESYTHRTTAHWKVVRDGSCGYEIVSPVLEGEDGFEQIRRVCAALDQAGARVNRHCGLHVHFDAADLAVEETKRLFKLWIKNEDILDSVQPVSRRDNNNVYCRSNRINEETFRAIDRAQSLTEIAQIYNHNRYHKLNIQSYWRHGTIEIRHHAGTTNAEKIVNWIGLMGAMCAQAKRCKRINPKMDTHLDGLARLKRFLSRTVDNRVVRTFFVTRFKSLNPAAGAEGTPS